MNEKKDEYITISPSLIEGWDEIVKDFEHHKRVMDYIIKLEDKVKKLEEERKLLEKQLSDACMLCTRGFTEDSECEEDGCQISECWSILGVKPEEESERT